MGNIAGVCDETGLVVGMMPHPERAVLGIHPPDWSRQSDRKKHFYGYTFFKNVIEYCS